MTCAHQAQAKLYDGDLKCRRCGRVGRVYPCGFGRSQLIWHYAGVPPTHDDIMIGVKARAAGQLSAVEQ